MKNIMTMNVKKVAYNKHKEHKFVFFSFIEENTTYWKTRTEMKKKNDNECQEGGL